MHEALYNWSIALLLAGLGLQGAEQVALWAQAEEKLLAARKITGKASYVLACLHAVRGQAAAALAELRACKTDGTLPGKAHLLADDDLISLRDDPGFRALVDSLP